MISFFKKKVTPDLSLIGVDMHSHLLPGLDDGLPDIDATLAFMRRLHDMGYAKLICTPHIMSDVYANSPSTILPKLTLVRKALAENNIPVKVEAAAEYMVDMEMEKIVHSGEQLLTFGPNYILIEMSFVAASPNIEQVVFALKLKGLQPILAHPERYNFYHHQFDQYERMIDMGCMLQVNLLSLLGYYGKPVKVIAEKLFEKKMVSLVGTDMHHQNHMDALNELATRKEFYKLISGAELINKSLL